MRRTIAGTAASLVAALAIGGPLAMASHAAPATLHCAGSTTAACAQLDTLAAQLRPVAPLLGTALAPLTSQASGLAARSDQASGVPTAEVVDVSETLLAQLGTLPAPVQKLVGATALGDVTDTLEALVAELTAPVAPAPQTSSSGSKATPAKTAPSSSVGAPFGGARAAEAAHSGGAASSGGSTSSAQVPDVPVGDPLALAPLALPDFGFDPSFAPAATEAVAPTSEVVEAAAITEALAKGDSHLPELAVVAILSTLLLVAAGAAQLQANRHQIPD